MPDIKHTESLPSQRMTVPRQLTGTAFTRAFHGYVTVQGRGTVAIPPDLRKRYRLDQPGAQVEITEREDGVLELRPTIAVPASEAWFWDERWQEGEREVDADVAAGLGTVYNNVDELVAGLEELSKE